MQQPPLVSIILVNFNQPALTVECLQSLEKLNYPRWEVVVVDNGSSVSPEPISAAFPNVPLVRSEKNLGFAGGNNLALPFCHGDLFFFLNNDTLVDPAVLDVLVDFLERHPGAGLVSPRIHYAEPPYLIQYAGTTPMNPVTIRNSGIGWREEDHGQYREERPTAYIHGAAMMTTRRVLEEVGPMDDGYFLYYEELDWTERIRKAGYEIWYCGGTHIFHKESAATGQESPLKIYYLNRNRLLFARRHFPPVRAFLAWVYFTLVALPKNTAVFLLKGRKDLAAALFRAYLWNLTHGV